MRLEGWCWFSPLLRALPFPTGLVFPAELNGAVHTAHPRNSLGRRSPPKAWHRRLVSLPPRPVFLKEITACHPLPPRSLRPGAGLPGPPRRRAGQAGRAGRAGGGVPRAQASRVLPGCHFGWRKGVSLHSQQGEFPGTPPPPSTLKGPAGRKEGEGKRAGKERGIRQHLPSGCGRGILTGEKSLAWKANVTPRRTGAPRTEHRGSPVLSGPIAEPGRAGARGAERGSPQPTGTHSWVRGPPPATPRDALRALRWGGDPAVPRKEGQSEVSLERSVRGSVRVPGSGNPAGQGREETGPGTPRSVTLGEPEEGTDGPFPPVKSAVASGVAAGLCPSSGHTAPLLRG